MAERTTAGKRKRPDLSRKGRLVDARQAFLPPRRKQEAATRGQLHLVEPGGPESGLPSAA